MESYFLENLFIGKREGFAQLLSSPDMVFYTLVSIKIGRNVLYRESDFLVWLESQPCISSTSELHKGKGD